LRYDRAPPLLGQHSDEILADLGLSDAEVKKLREGGII
jgi:crotonobetainyl-CoA:carnitine CoA-transferase CaiB-like acyl-CoA transferase